MELAIFPTVAQIAKKDLLRASMDMTVRLVSSMILEGNVSSVVLEKEGHRYIFSVEDILKLVHQGDNLDHRLAELTLHRADCIDGDEHVLAAMEYLEKSDGRYLAVVDQNDVLIGIVTHTDILSAMDPTVLVEKKTIGELVARKEPVTFAPDWILEDVLSHFSKMEDSIIVVETGVPIGIVTTRDVFALITSGQDISKPLSEYMNGPVVTTLISATIHETLNQLKTFHIKRAVVVDVQGKLVGVVTQSELVGFAYGTWINLIKHHASELRELVTILEAKARGFEIQSNTDALTGLANRRVLQRRVSEEIERLRRYNASSFSLVLLDIDFFKNINDTYGHLFGDDVLKVISREISGEIRKTDVAVRCSLGR